MSGSPFGFIWTSTPDIAFPLKIGSKNPVSILSPEIWSTITREGGER